MTYDPHDYNNTDPPTEPTDLYPDEETYVLHKEEQRLATARRRSIFDWIANSIYLLVGALEILLGIRFFLRLSGANPDNMFAQFIFKLSEPFASPFSTLFISPTANPDATLGLMIFDINLLIGMAIYALLGLLAVRLVRFFEGR
jgi:YggT family protein